MFCCSHSKAFEIIQEKDRKLLKFSIYSTFITTFFIVLCRLIAYFTTQSIAIEAALFDAIQDCFISSLNAILVLRSIKPADHLYPFGYGKIEACAAFAQATFLLGLGVFLMWKSLLGMTSHHHDVLYNSTAIIVLSISLFLIIMLACIQTFVAKRTQSLAILADSAHYKSDIALNFGIIFCLLISFRSAWFDIAIGIIIAGYLLITSIKIGIPSIQILLDRSLPTKTIQVIEDIISKAGAQLHSLQTHRLSRGEFILIRLDCKDEIPVSKLKELEDQTEHALREKFPRSDIVFSLAHHA